MPGTESAAWVRIRPPSNSTTTAWGITSVRAASWRRCSITFRSRCWISSAPTSWASRRTRLSLMSIPRHLNCVGGGAATQLASRYRCPCRANGGYRVPLGKRHQRFKTSCRTPYSTDRRGARPPSVRRSGTHPGRRPSARSRAWAVSRRSAPAASRALVVA